LFLLGGGEGGEGGGGEGGGGGEIRLACWLEYVHLL